MLNDISHTGFTVASLQRSLAFYRDLLGMEIVFERLACEDFVQRLTDAPGGRLKFVHLKVPGSMQLLELLEYQGVERKAVSGRPRDAGVAHICFFVPDLASLYKRLQQAGVESVSDPVVSTAGRNAGSSMVYVRDPDGFWVELVEKPYAPTRVSPTSL